MLPSLTHQIAYRNPLSPLPDVLQTQEWKNCFTAGSPPTLQCIPYVIGNLIAATLFFAGIAAVVIIIMAGYKFITSGGDVKKVSSAKATLAFAIIGLIIIIFSFLIINLIAYLSGTQCITILGF